MRENARSQALFERARGLIPGGVNSPVRAWKAVGGAPAFVQRAQGSRVWDVDGNELIDYVGSWGPMILGHAHPAVLQEIAKTLTDGTSFGAPTAREVELAEALSRALPSVQMLRLVSSGTEAAMSAIRLARGYSGRTKIIKLDGCYHGHADSLLVRAGSGAATFAIPDSAGVPEAVARETLVANFNDIASVRRLLAAHPEQVAAVIIEPVVGNMGTILPAGSFLADLRQVTRDAGTLLIFDEVITGFRLAYGGAQGVFGIDPDLTVLGKIVGGGLPLAAFGGRREILEQLAPLGPVYQAGTLSGNPLAVSAGLATLEQLRRPGTYEQLEASGARLEAGLRAALRATKTVGCVNRVGSMWTIFFGVEAVHDAASARCCNTETFARWFQGMLEQGIYLPPSQFEAAFVSLAHTDEQIDRTIAAAQQVMAQL